MSKDPKVATTEVSVINISMPFWSMVVFMFKWAIATIPALILLMFAGSLVVSSLIEFGRMSMK